MCEQQRIEGSLLEYAHEIVRSHLKPGDLAVDATLGNGHDMLFLTRCVGQQGRVFGFDIQTNAIDTARQRLQDAGIEAGAYCLLSDSHANMARYVFGEVRAVMFNLGYLPGGDKSIITRPGTTLQALSVAMELLGSGGILTVMCYPGHDGGNEESGLVTDWLVRMAPASGELRGYCRAGASASAPFLWVMTKKSG